MSLLQKKRMSHVTHVCVSTDKYFGPLLVTARNGRFRKSGSWNLGWNQLYDYGHRLLAIGPQRKIGACLVRTFKSFFQL